MKPKPAFTWDDVDAVMQRVVPAEIPAGAFTCGEYAERMGISPTHAGRLLVRAVKGGRMRRARLGVEYHYWIEK